MTLLRRLLIPSRSRSVNALDFFRPTKWQNRKLFLKFATLYYLVAVYLITGAVIPAGDLLHNRALQTPVMLNLVATVPPNADGLFEKIDYSVRSTTELAPFSYGFYSQNYLIESIYARTPAAFSLLS